MTLDWPNLDRPKAPADPRSERASPLLLVVEDHKLNAVLMRDTLQSFGFKALVAHDAHEAIRLTWALRPDLILMDICLPGPSGLEATRIIKSNPSLCRIPVVAVTAQAMTGDEERILEGGCEGYLSKPFRMAELLNLVRDTLQAHAYRGLLPPKIQDLPKAS